MATTTPPTAPTTADFETLLVRGATVTLVVAGGWLAVVVVAGVVEALSAGRVRGLARVGCPPAWRPVVLLLVGAVLTLPTGAAHAAQPPEDARSDGHGLPLPTRPVEPPSRVVETRVVVQPHDTLWSIVRQRLSATADDATVMTNVARLHRANRALIGEEPDLIHPGQRLVLPLAPREGARR